MGIALPIFSALAAAQAANPAAAAPAANAGAGFAYGSLADSLQQLQQAIEINPANRLHTDQRDRTRYQAAQSAIQRNLQQAVPGLLQAAQSQPQNLAAAFRLYRDLEAVEQVARQVAATGLQHGHKPDSTVLYQSARQLEAQISRLADYIQATATRQQLWLQQQARQAQARAAAARRAPRRLIINNANVEHRHVDRRRPKRRRRAHPAASRRHPPAKKTSKKTKPTNSTTPH